MGSAFGPTCGGKLTDTFGFQKAGIILCYTTVAVALVNFCFVILPDFICKKPPKIDRENYDSVVKGQMITQAITPATSGSVIGSQIKKSGVFNSKASSV
jgi:hypothetical protein